MNPTRVLLADDDELVRAGLRALVEALPGYQVVAEASDGREALQWIEQHRPDIVLMDLTMPELDGVAATRQVSQLSPATRVIILSAHSREACVLDALQAGAVGYLLKNIRPAEFAVALEAVSRGETYLCSAASKHVVAACLHGGGVGSQTLSRLTPRQRDVLKLIAEGNTTKAVASKLGIRFKTAENHRSAIMHRLDIHDTATLVRFAIRMGVVSSEQ